MGSRVTYPQNQPSPEVSAFFPESTKHHGLTHYRKRAKTEDEKEQRRIERVLRNRQAAQSSRERKRQEVEKLEGEKHSIEEQNDMLRQRLLAAEHEKFKLQQQNNRLVAELSALRRGSTSTQASMAPSPNFAMDHFTHPPAIKKELDDSFYLRTPISLPSDSFSPSPSASIESRSPSPSSPDLGFHLLTASPDMTQHPAAMLCDLQCQSGRVSSASTIRPTARDGTLHHTSSLPNHNTPLTNPSFFPILISTVYSQLLFPLLQICLSLKTGSPLPIHVTIHPATLRLIRWLILTPADLANPFSIPKSTTTASSTVTRIYSRTTTPSKPIFRTRLLRRLLLCSPALARPLLGATVRAMRAERGVALAERKARGRGAELEKSWSRLMVLALAVECITKDMERSCISRSKDRDLGRGR